MTRQPHRAVDAAEQSAALLTSAGMPRMPSRVLTALLAAPPEGYTAAELGDRLGISAAAVSGAVRYLQTVGVAQRLARPGERRDRYRLTDDTWYAALAGKGPLYEQLAQLMDRIASETGGGQAGEMARFFRFIGERMPDLLAEWEELRAREM
ncbi:GbsR/MarR family transcriptional regulator [Microbacterium sp. NPDC091313]